MAVEYFSRLTGISHAMTDAMTIDEPAVIAAARAGDRAAFDALVRTYQRRAYAAAYHYTRNREEARDVAQDAFVKAYKAMNRFDPRMPFYPWLYRIVCNTALNHLKKRARRRESSLDDLMEAGGDAVDGQRTPCGHAELNDVQELVAEGLAALTPGQREILRLRHLQEMSYADIAAVLDIPPGTVMSRLHSARKALKEFVERRTNKNPEDGVL